MTENILEFQNVSFRYEGSSEKEQLPLAVRDVSFSVKKGDFVAILGHNGSGKSTLAKLSNSILLPESGKVLVNWMDTADESLSYDIRRTVGVVFQNPDNQIVASVVEEDVAFGPENLGVPPEEIRKRVDNALKAVGMYEYRKHEPHKLSGGQKQRVAIAGMIAMLPECIVLDEPTAMLDPAGRREVMRVIRDLNSRLGITVVLITHHMDEAVQAQRVVVMHRGKVLMQGTPREIFTQVDALRAASLTVPQTIEVLFDLDNQIGSDLPIDALTVDECADILEGYLRPTAAN